MHRNINEEIFELAYKLKKNYIISIISNMPDLHAKRNKEMGLFKEFFKPMLSCDVKLMKPQEEIFELALNRLKLKPEECIFIDDREEHLDIPKRMGFKIIHFENNNQIIEELKRFNIKIV